MREWKRVRVFYIHMSRASLQIWTGDPPFTSLDAAVALLGQTQNKAVIQEESPYMRDINIALTFTSYALI